MNGGPVQTGGAPSPESRERVRVGRVVRVHGIKGEVVVAFDGGDAERFQGFGSVEAEKGSQRAVYSIDGVRPFKRGGLVKFRGIETPEEARAWMGADLFVETASLPEPEPGSYYHYQLVGIRVRTEAGDDVGVVESVIDAGGGDLLSVRREGREHLIPLVSEFVLSVDVGAGLIVVRLPEGLLDL